MKIPRKEFTMDASCFLRKHFIPLGNKRRKERINHMKKMTAKRWLILALALVFIGFIGASLIQTNFGDVSITKLNFETEDGLTLSALLLIPDSATADNPAPAVVTVHGW